MRNSRKPSGFWMSRVMVVAAIHFMLFGMMAMFIGTMTWCIPSDCPPLYRLIHPLYEALSLPLVAPLKGWGFGETLAYLPFGVPALIGLIIYAANSLVWGFAVDGYLRIVSGLSQRWRDRRPA